MRGQIRISESHCVWVSSSRPHRVAQGVSSESGEHLPVWRTLSGPVPLPYLFQSHKFILSIGSESHFLFIPGMNRDKEGEFSLWTESPVNLLRLPLVHGRIWIPVATHLLLLSQSHLQDLWASGPQFLQTPFTFSTWLWHQQIWLLLRSSGRNY